jgi:ABC-2 type transport system ATP-binding protein
MLIEVEHLRKVYGAAPHATVAVDDLTLSVGRGEVFGFLGPNGAGKTTTVKMLLGLVRPTSGIARLLGHLPGDPLAMTRVGFLPEHFRFHPWLTAADFLDVHGRLHGLTTAQRRERIPRLLARVGLAERADFRLGEFSKGMAQRVGLAQALINDPELVFLDEPTSGLDPVGRYEVRDLIRDLRAAGVTVFLNSHYLSEVEVTCDRIAIMKRGRVVRMGALSALAGQTPELEIIAAGLTPEIHAGLAQWGHIAFGPAPHPTSPDGAQRLVLSIASDEAAPAIADWLVQHGARLYTLAPHRLSLEELFLRTMAEET